MAQLVSVCAINSATFCTTISLPTMGSMLTSEFDGAGSIWLASTTGLFRIRLPSLIGGAIRVPLMSNCVPVSMSVGNGDSVSVPIAFGFNCSVTVGAMVRAVINRATQGIDRWMHYYSPGVIDLAPLGVAFDNNDRLWMADNVVHVQDTLSDSLRIRRFASLEQLPRDTANSVVTTLSGGVWIGTAKGLLRYGTRPLQPLAVSKWKVKRNLIFLLFFLKKENYSPKYKGIDGRSMVARSTCWFTVAQCNSVLLWSICRIDECITIRNRQYSSNI